MAKAAKKPLHPGARLIVGEIEQAAPDALVIAVLDGWAAKIAADDAKKRLDAENARLIELLAEVGPAAVVLPGLCRATYVERESVKIVDPERLEKVLGPARYLDMVRLNVSHKAEPRLIEMAADGDEPLQPAIAACLQIGETQAVTWRAEK